MAKKHCPNCGGALDIHPTDAIITCSYCGTSFTPDGTKMKEHFALQVNYSESDALDTLKAYLVKVPGVANDLAQQISLKEISMTYYPYWVYTVQGDVSYRGIDKKASFRVSQEDDIQAFTGSGLQNRVIKNKPDKFVSMLAPRFEEKL